MRVCTTGILLLGLIALFPLLADAQSPPPQNCQTFSLPELNTLDGTIDNTDCVVTPTQEFTW